MAKMTRSNLNNKPLKIVADRQLMDLTRDEFYEKEKSQVFKQIKNMIDKLMIEKERLKQCGNSIQEDEMNSLSASVKPLHYAITKFKKLMKAERYHLEKLPDSMNLMERIRYQRSRMKTFDQMESAIRSLMMNYNEIGRFLKFPTKDLFKNIKQESVPSYYQEEKPKLCTQRELLLSDLRSSTQLLKSKIFDSRVAPIYRMLADNVPEQRYPYQCSCTLYGMYVEGSAKSKFQAMQMAATKMMRLILKRQLSYTLTPDIKPFSEKELKDFRHIMSTENYVQQLEKICAKNKRLQTTLAYEMEYRHYPNVGPRYTIRCRVEGFAAIGLSNKLSVAKQIAAQGVISLMGKAKSRELFPVV